MKTLAISIVAILLSAGTAWSQDSKMEVFNDLVGNWKGIAKMQSPEGQSTIEQTEEINYELGGKILVIRGTGRTPGADSVSFSAFGVIHYEKETDSYKFSAYTMEGNYVLADARFENDIFIWEFDVPGGKIQYSLNFDNKTWIEDGKFSRDGNQWFPFFHMELEKQ